MFDHAQSALLQIDFTRLATTPAVLTIKEQPFVGSINLRGRADNKDFVAAIESVSGLSLPIAANTFTQNGERKLIWLGPDEWLMLTEKDQQSALCAAFKDAFANTFATATDISGGNTVVEVKGEYANDFLAKGTAFDLHESVFKTGHSTQTVLAHAGATILKTGDAPIYQLIFRRSFADYLGNWMLDAAKEFAD